MVHVAEVVGLDPEVLPAHAPHGEAELDLLGRAHVVHHQAGAEALHRFGEAGALAGIERLDLAQQVDRRADPALVALVHRLRDERAHRVRHHREPHPTVEGGAQEGVRVLGRGRLGREDHDPVVADEEVVHHRGVHPRAEVDQHEVDRQLAQVRYESHALEVPGLRGREIRVRRGDQAQVRHAGLDQQLREVLLPVRDEVRQAPGGRRDAEAGVDVRALEVAVDDDHLVALARDGRRDVHRDEGLADAALAAAHGDHARGIRRGRPAGAGRAGLDLAVDHGAPLRRATHLRYWTSSLFQ